MNKLILIIAVLFLFSCKTRKVNIEKTEASAQIERIVEEKKAVTEKKEKDSVKVVEKKDEQKEQSTNIKVEFDPKINDSLDVKYKVGNDSLNLKITGNGKVFFDFKTAKKETQNVISEIFGSKTLANIDSVISEKESEKTQSETHTKAKEVTETGFSIWIYIGGFFLLALIVILFWFFGKPKK